MLVPLETLDAECLSLTELKGVADIEELNKNVERAVLDVEIAWPGLRGGESTTDF